LNGTIKPVPWCTDRAKLERIFSGTRYRSEVGKDVLLSWPENRSKPVRMAISELGLILGQRLFLVELREPASS
jgi:hypothetical protein